MFGRTPETALSQTFCPTHHPQRNGKLKVRAGRASKEVLICVRDQELNRMGNIEHLIHVVCQTRSFTSCLSSSQQLYDEDFYYEVSCGYDESIISI